VEIHVVVSIRNTELTKSRCDDWATVRRNDIFSNIQFDSTGYDLAIKYAVAFWTMNARLGALSPIVASHGVVPAVSVEFIS
jgi:hypothetical protein